MIYAIDEALFERYPDFCRGVVYVAGADNSATSAPELSALLDREMAAVKSDESLTTAHPKIAAWAEVYRSFPLPNARKIQPSVASLVRRLKKDAQSRIPFISPFVCISNLASLRYLVPSGLIDRDKIAGDLKLGYADGTESFEAFGDERIVSPEVGEVIYYDTGSKTVLCRAWNSKGGKATMIDATTRSAVIDIDALEGVMGREEVVRALDEIAGLVTRHCGGETKRFILHKDNPAVSLGA